MIECKYCVLDAGEQRQALDSDDVDFVKALLYSAAVRYDKVSAEGDKYLTEVSAVPILIYQSLACTPLLISRSVLPGRDTAVVVSAKLREQP